MMKVLTFFCVLVAANGMRVKQQKEKSAVCNFEVTELKQCESPAVMLKCKSECEERCDDITADECKKGNPAIVKMCASTCETKVADSPSGGKKKIDCNAVDEAQCARPRVMAECRSQCSNLGGEDEIVTPSHTGGKKKIKCDEVDEDACASPRVMAECREQCSSLGEEANDSSVQSAHSVDKCDIIVTLDQCVGPWLEVCDGKCKELRQEAEDQTCVDLQAQGEVTRVSLKKLLGLGDSQAEKILSFQPIFSWEQLEKRLTGDLNLKSVLLPKLDKAKICKPIGVYEDEDEEVPSPVTSATVEKEPEPPSVDEEPECVDINGGEAELRRVRGVGKASAQIVLDIKADGGDFTSWDEFKKRIDSKQRKALKRGKATPQSNLIAQLRKLVQQKCNMFCSIDGKQPFPCSQ